MALSNVEAMEVMITVKIWKWLGFPPSATNIAFYGHANKLSLPLSALSEEFKVVKVQNFMTIRSSSDPVVHSVVPESTTGRKWIVAEEVDALESRLHHNEVVGATQSNRAGFGSQPLRLYSKASEKGKREMVVEELREELDEARQSRAIGLVQQGRWTNWEEVESQQLSWREVREIEPDVLRFWMKAIYDLLASPANLNRGYHVSETCHWCGSPATLCHILCGCHKALGGGLYT